jgi:hypothetical protein
MRLTALIVAGVVLSAAQSAAKGPTAPKTVFGVVWNLRVTTFAKLDPLTLKSVSKQVPLGVAAAYLGPSPGRGARAVFTTGEGGTALAFVDLASMKRVGRLSLPCAVSGPVVWADARRLVLTCGSSASSVLVVDPLARKLRSRKRIPGELVEVERANDMLVGVAAPLGEIGPARLVVVDARGRMRTLRLPQIRAGTREVDPRTSRFRTETPALAINPSGRYAAIVPATGPVVVVDLHSLKTTSHALTARVPAAAAKNVEGTIRTAVWTWGGTIAVAGRNASGDVPDQWQPAGLKLIDTDGWNAKTVDARATDVLDVGGGAAILSWATLWNAQARATVGDGLTGYDATGTARFHVLAGQPVYVGAVVGRYAYLISHDLQHFRVVDTNTGRVLATPHTLRAVTLFAP